MRWGLFSPCDGGTRAGRRDGEDTHARSAVRPSSCPGKRGARPSGSASGSLIPSDAKGLRQRAGGHEAGLQVLSPQVPEGPGRAWAHPGRSRLSPALAASRDARGHGHSERRVPAAGPGANLPPPPFPQRGACAPGVGGTRLGEWEACREQPPGRVRCSHSQASDLGPGTSQPQFTICKVGLTVSVPRGPGAWGGARRQTRRSPGASAPPLAEASSPLWGDHPRPPRPGSRSRGGGGGYGVGFAGTTCERRPSRAPP